MKAISVWYAENCRSTLDKIILGLDVLLLLLYTYILCSLTYVVHPELFSQFIPMVEMNHSLIEKLFNSVIIENGMYRPRVLCFLLEYIDCNCTLLLSAITHKAVFITQFLSGYVYVGVLYSLFRKILGNVKPPFVLLLAILPIFTQPWLASMRILCRASKLYTPIFVAMLYSFWLKYGNEYNYTRKNRCWYIVTAFAGMLLDEQIIFFVLSILGIQLLVDLIHKFNVKNNLKFCDRISPFVYDTAFTMFLYVIWYKFIGRILFTLFTPVSLQDHMHSFAHPFERLSIVMLMNSFSAWNEANSVFFKPIPFVFVLLCVIYFIFKKVRIREKRTELLLLLLCSFILVYACCCSHPRIYILKDLSHGFYMLTTSLMCYIVVVNLLTEFDWSKIAVKYCSLGILCVMLSINIFNVGDYLDTHIGYAGHMYVIEGQMDIFEQHGITDYFLSDFKLNPPIRENIYY